MKLPKTKYITLSLLGTVLLLFSGCGSEQTETNTQMETISATVHTVQSTAESSEKTYGGEIQSRNSARIATKVMGEIKAIPFDIGESFEPGDLILQIKQEQIDAQEEQALAALSEARVAFEQAQKDLQRFEALYKEGSASDKELENARNHLAMSESRMNRAEAKRDEILDLKAYTQIRAPYAGVVTAKHMNEGDLASPGMPVISIEEGNSYKLVFTIPETAVSRFSVGQEILIRVPGLANSDIQATLSRINSSGERGSRQFKAEAEINEPNEAIRSGMYAEAVIPTGDNTSVTIPASSVVSRGQLSGVFALNSDNIALLRWITLGEETEQGYVVLSGLREGERIVENITGSVYDGVRISNGSEE